jgi:hypothetical protein
MTGLQLTASRPFLPAQYALRHVVNPVENPKNVAVPSYFSHFAKFDDHVKTPSTRNLDIGLLPRERLYRVPYSSVESTEEIDGAASQCLHSGDSGPEKVSELRAIYGRFAA